MVSVPRAQRTSRGQVARPGTLPVVVVDQGVGVIATFSPQQLRLLAALVGVDGGRLPARRATRAMWPSYQGPLTPSMRASAARSITRLAGFDLVARDSGDVAITERGRTFVATLRGPDRWTASPNLPPRPRPAGGTP